MMLAKLFGSYLMGSENPQEYENFIKNVYTKNTNLWYSEMKDFAYNLLLHEKQMKYAYWYNTTFGKLTRIYFEVPFFEKKKKKTIAVDTISTTLSHLTFFPVSGRIAG